MSRLLICEGICNVTAIALADAAILKWRTATSSLCSRKTAEGHNQQYYTEIDAFPYAHCVYTPHRARSGRWVCVPCGHERRWGAD